IYCFENGVEREVWCSSADWMERNLLRRVEVAFPVKAIALSERIVGELAFYLADDTDAWTLGADGSWRRPACAQGEPVVAQQELMRNSESDRNSAANAGP
ncbi:MAG: hypothetical protein ACRESR_02820, partial [Gammaproteobacteria bacterium]